MLVYAEGFRRVPDDEAKIAIAEPLIARLIAASLAPVIAMQSLAELHRVLVRRRRLTPAAASTTLSVWRNAGHLVATNEEVFEAALQLASDHQLQIYDSIIFVASVHGGADILLSEDMQHGFTWRGLTVLNPFAPEPDPRVANLLR